MRLGVAVREGRITMDIKGDNAAADAKALAELWGLSEKQTSLLESVLKLYECAGRSKAYERAMQAIKGVFA